MDEFPVSEIFGPTIQGEGIYIGKKVSFIRFGGCDCRCSWCDTKYAWDVDKCNQMSVEDILEEVQTSPDTVVLTGGNPLLYDIGNLVERLFLKFTEVHVETQGTIWKDWLPYSSFVSISPKKESLMLPVLDKIVSTLAGRCQLKIVIFDDADLKFAKEINSRYPHVPLALQIGYPSEDNGKVIADLFVFDAEFNNSVRILPQLHRIFWGNRKGV